MRSFLKRVLSPRHQATIRRSVSWLRERWRRQHRVHRMLALPFPRRLDVLARIYGTDKSSKFHGYAKWYEQHLSARRKSVRSVLEIGIGGITSHAGYETEAGGQSLRLWQHYFPNAHIVGIDIEHKVVKGPRISVEQGSQDDVQFLAHIADRFGPFDLIVDDGSHIGRHVRASFDALFEHVKPGGTYVIEDLALAYAPELEGGPPGTPGTQAELVKGLVDDVHRGYWDRDGGALAIRSLHLYDQIVFIERAM